MLQTVQLCIALRMNHIARRAAERAGEPAPDPVPVICFSVGGSPPIWLATELAEDGDTLFGVADMGFGYVELGEFSLRDIADMWFPDGMRVERDCHFVGQLPISAYLRLTRRSGGLSCPGATVRSDAPS